MYSNSIDTIDSLALSSLVNLELLDLYANRLGYLHEAMFYGCRNLRKLWLNENQIEEMTFAGLVKLEELDLSFNRLKYLNEHFMHGLNNLRKLSFSHNRLETIEMFTFRNLTRLNELWLDYNGGLVVKKRVVYSWA